MSRHLLVVGLIALFAALACSAPTGSATPEPAGGRDSGDHSTHAGTATPSPAVGTTTAPEAPSPAAQSTATASPAAEGAPTVVIDRFSFAPEQITVAVGTTVTWRNDETALHSVTHGTPESPGGAFDSGLFDTGETFSHTFDTPGTYVYHCTRHPFMRGTVVVE